MTEPSTSQAGRSVAASRGGLDRIVVFGNPNKARTAEVLRALTRWAAQKGVAVSVAEGIAPGLAGCAGGPEAYKIYSEDGASQPAEPEERALVVCLGGDGTLICAIRRLWPLGMPVLGVDLGSLSFNAAAEADRLEEAIERFAQGRSEISQRMVLRVRRLRGGETVAQSVAVNDVVLAKHSDARLIHLTLRQGRTLVSAFAADGLILATPTGSTAYNLSSGGPIIYPTLRAIVASAICPHTLTARPVVLEPSPPVVLQFQPHHGMNEANLWIDGQEKWAVTAEDRVEVEADPTALSLISQGDAEYFDRLRRKLCWSGEVSPAAPKPKDNQVSAQSSDNEHEGRA